MGLPDDTCVELTIDIAAFLDLSIPLIGGVGLHAKLKPGTLPNLADIVASVLEPLNAALTPLAPIFNLLDTIVAIVEFCKAIPDALGPPPDPSKIAAALKKILKAYAKVIAMLPPLSIPVMIVGICKVITAALLALIDSIEHMITVTASLQASRDKATLLAKDPDLLVGAAALSASIDCAQADLDLLGEVNMGGLGPLNKFMDLLNTFAGLAGLPSFAKIEGGGDPLKAIDPLKNAVNALAAVCASIPV